MNWTHIRARVALVGALAGAGLGQSTGHLGESRVERTAEKADGAGASQVPRSEPRTVDPQLCWVPSAHGVALNVNSRVAGGVALVYVQSPAGAQAIARLALDHAGQGRLEVGRLPRDSGLQAWVSLYTDSGQWSGRSESLPVGPAAGQRTAQRGEVLVSEVMKDPVQVNDGVGEWFELFNATNIPIDIEGWVLSDRGSDATVLSNGGAGIFVPARSYLVLAREANPNLNGGVFGAVAYTGMTLSNGADEIILSSGGVLVDEIAYDDGQAWPDAAGKSLQLDTRSLAPVWNDDGSRWCEGTLAYGLGDLGTPGSRNDDCP